MTSRFDLKNALEEEIDRDVQRLLDGARSEGEQLLDEARSRRDRLRQQAQERFEREAQLRRRRALSRARLGGRNALLELRRKEVDRVFEETARILENLGENDPQRYADMLGALFRQGRRLFPKGPLRLRAGETEARLLKPILKEEDVDIVTEEELHGIILETPDGRIRCDDTPAALLGRIRAEREAELERLLFEENHESE